MDGQEKENRNQLIERLLAASAQEDVTDILSQLRPEDIAEIIESVDRDEKVRIIRYLDYETLAEVLPKIEADSVSLCIEEFGPDFVARILEKMAAEEVAEALTETKEKNASLILDIMEKSDSERVRKVLQYPEDTAGRLMSSDYVAMNENTSPAKVIEYIRQKELEEPFYYIYVVDNENKFIGSVPIHKVLFAGKNQKLGELIEEDSITVSVDMDQEQVARIVEKYDIPALPVLDEDNRLVGRITVDDVIDVINEENTEDIYRMVGTDYEELHSESAFKIARIRLPWLLTCMLGSLLSGAVIHHFEVTLVNAIVLVSFIPVIMSTGGNTGLQSCTIMVRRMALGNVSSYNIMSSILKELRTALTLGFVCGGFLFLIARVWRGTVAIGLIIGVSMFAAVSVSSMVGMFIPILFKKIKIDPAVASGPLITTINDMIGLSIYLILSTLLLAQI